jgi:hypothetical protein
MKTEQAIRVTWEDGGREPQCPPNPAYPSGIDLDMARGTQHACKVELPYPAKRCGHFVVKCRACGTRAVVTTAGRPDDPRSVRIPCLREAAPTRYYGANATRGMASG